MEQDKSLNKERITKKQRYQNIIKWFEENMPVAETELKYSDPFELLVAVILSAQCTDKRVNMVTPKLLHILIIKPNIWWVWLKN